MLKRLKLYLYSPSTAVACRKTKPKNRGGLNSEEENEIGRQRWEERTKKKVSDGGARHRALAAGARRWWVKKRNSERGMETERDVEEWEKENGLMMVVVGDWRRRALGRQNPKKMKNEESDGEGWSRRRGSMVFI